MNTENVIQVTDVKKYFKAVKAIDGIDLSIRKGEYLALLGPNGAGKTTLVEMIEGIQKPDTGKILIMGKKWRGNEENLHKVIGISLQETYFFDKLTVAETFTLFASFFHLGSGKTEEVMELVNLTEKRKSYVVNLSGGQKQKLALGISLLNSPQILLLDEPTTGLDPVARREIWNILTRLKEEKITSLLLTTHYMEEAEILCDRIIILYYGKIIAQGTLNELLAENLSAEIIEFTINEYLHLLNFPSCEGMKKVMWDEKSSTGKIVVSNITKFLPVFSKFLVDNSFTLKSFQFKKMTLDDLFISLTGKNLTD